MRAPDRIVRGRIATLAGDAGFGWVEAIAIASGRVVAAGPAGEIETLAGPRTRRLDLPPDAVAVPGLIDAHLHLVDAALAARRIDLEGCSIEAAVTAVGAAARTAPPEDWLIGSGWDPAVLGRWPTSADLERVAPGRSVLLWSHDRHAAWVSRRVLALAGIDADRPDPPGGAIRREATVPTGVLHELAADLAVRLLAEPSRSAVEAATLDYARGLVRLGITGLQDAGGLEAADLGTDVIRDLAGRGALPIRVQRSVRPPGLKAAIAAGLRTGDALGDDPASRARMGWLKLFADGSLGSRTALLVDPPGDRGNRAIALAEPEELAALSARASGAGIVPQIHAIGDAALRVALDTLEPLAARHRTGAMARIEHVQLARPEDLGRFAAARIAASIQPIHLRTDRDKASEAWGAERSERDAFRIRSLSDAGAVVAFGSDAPVEPADPWPGIELAVSRRAPEWADGRGFGPQEAIDLPAALRAATVGPATIAADRRGGRLVPGCRADLVVITSAAIDEPVEPGGPLRSARPSLVLVEGEVSFEA